MQTKKKRNRVVAVLAGLSWALTAWSTDTPPQASSYLSLAVGNSWTYHNHYSDIREGDIAGYGVRVRVTDRAGRQPVASRFSSSLCRYRQ